MEGDKEVRLAWDRLSVWWDLTFGDADPFHLQLVYPFLDECLALAPGQRLLDLACGNGALARRFARHGVRVTAVDFSRGFLDIAAGKSAELDGIEFLELDLTDPDDLARLPEHAFDAAVCSMALHDMERIEPLLCALPRALTANGKFACAIPHPHFNSTPQMSVLREDDYSQPAMVTTYSLRIRDYLSLAAFVHRVKDEQPLPHCNFHRPLQSILPSCFAAGFRMEAYYEPSGALLPEDSPSIWKKLPGIPPVLIMSFSL